MTPRYWFVMIGQLVAAALLVGVWAFIPGASAASGPQLRSFSSAAELQAFLDRAPPENLVTEEAAPAADAAAPAADAAADASAAPILYDVAPAPELRAAAESPRASQITNVQTAGVDEGGIVKVHGRHLVVLRRGRLFTVATGGGSLRAADQIDAFPPSGDGSEAWYDEMLIAGDMVVVVGFNYGRSGTEINRFAIDDDGQLTYRDTYILRSNDYYSSENYASRLIGTTLVVYSPLMLRSGRSSTDALPALAHYDAANRRLGAFELIASPSDIFVAPDDIAAPDYVAEVAHSVSRCDLSADELDCSSVVVLGGWSRSFYVAADTVYVWTQGRDDKDSPRLYRIPLADGAPSLVTVSGMPIDQFSFREDSADGMLNVLVQGDGNAGGDAMWDSEESGGKMRLLRLPLSRFASGSGDAESALYRDLPATHGYGVQNRFVAGYLLYAGQEGAAFDDRGIGRREPVQIHVVPLAGGGVVSLRPGHDVGRFDIIGRDAVAIGTDAHDALVFSTVALGARPSLFNQFRMPSTNESESRSQAFFYRPDPDDVTGDNGLLGLPIMKGVDRDAMAPNAGERGAILFARRANRTLSLAGELASRADRSVDDDCHASCTDWYGNARPIFLGNRIFALMGYELVEGRMAGERITEVRRVNFAPGLTQGR
ncbi:MAG: beta-propeller domain-containing protein [Sphingopyxis sp.]